MFKNGLSIKPVQVKADTPAQPQSLDTSQLAVQLEQAGRELMTARTEVAAVRASLGEYTERWNKQLTAMKSRAEVAETKLYVVEVEKNMLAESKVALDNEIKTLRAELATYDKNPPAASSRFDLIEPDEDVTPVSQMKPQARPVADVDLLPIAVAEKRAGVDRFRPATHGKIETVRANRRRVVFATIVRAITGSN